MISLRTQLYSCCFLSVLLILGSNPALADYSKDSEVNSTLNALEMKGSAGPIVVLAKADTDTVTVVTPGAVEAETPVVAEPAAPEAHTLFGDFVNEFNLKISGSTTVDAYSSYIWRGQSLDKDAVVQPGASLTVQDFTFGYWGNWDVENKDALSSDESDYYVSFAHAVTDYLTLGVGHTWYGFPEGHTSSKEYFLSASLPTTFLSPVFTYFHDYEDGQDLNTDGSGNYYSLGVSKSVPLGDKYGSSLELATTGGYVDGQWLSGKGSHVTPSVGVKLMLAPNVTVTPTVGYNFPMGDLKDENIGNQKNTFFSGVKTAYSF